MLTWSLLRGPSSHSPEKAPRRMHTCNSQMDHLDPILNDGEAPMADTFEHLHSSILNPNSIIQCFIWLGNFMLQAYECGDMIATYELAEWVWGILGFNSRVWVNCWSI